MKKLYLVVGIFILSAFILEIVFIYLSNTISTDSILATDLQVDIEKLSQDNAALKSEILTYSSYDYISKKAKELGFVENPSYISLFSPQQVALKHE